MSYPNDLQDQDHVIGDPNQTDAIGSGMRPETADFLNDLAGIGTGAFLDMRQADAPEYQDWRDGNFVADDSGNYVSQEGQSYTDDDLERMHGVLSRQAGNPLISRLFNGPKSDLADYMTWRNQNFDNPKGGGWEDEDGNLYTEQALQGMFGAKFATQSGQEDVSEQAASAAADREQQGVQPTETDDEQQSDENSEPGEEQQPDLLAQNTRGRQAGQRPGQEQQQRQPPGRPAGQRQPQGRDSLTQAERDEVAGVAYSESTRGTVAEHEAIASVILNRARSGDRQYVNHGQRLNVHNVIHATPGGTPQFQGVGGRNQRHFAGTNDPGSQNARTAAANVARSGPTNQATAFVVTGGREPTARKEGNLGNVHRTGRVGNVFLYEPGPAPETPVLPRGVPLPQPPRSQSPISSPPSPQQLPDNEQQ